ncbi:MAG TPA: amidohydrolase family protein, partial [Thermoanaerobaculia bacterium]|nr:amidohydrolase family protein [Thermoanaerobaculia bacterium]
MTKQLWGRVFVDGAVRDSMLVTIDGEQIVDVAHETRAPEGAHVVHGVVSPGFIDVHVHGGDGADFMDGSDEAAARVATFHATQGTTTLAATTLSGSREDLQRAVSAIARVSRERLRGAEICGVHLEGPYINRERAGAQDAASIRAASIDEIAALHAL